MSEADLKELQDEDVDLGVRRRVEYEDEEDGTLALVIPKREGGGEIEIPLLEHARTVFERTDGNLQDNTMLAVRPLAEVGRNRPVQRSGVTTNTGIATAMLRPGYLYVFFDNRLWRELEVGPDGKLSDVDVEHYREQAEGGDTPNERDSAGEWLDNILLPAMLQGQATLHRVRLAYSEIAWSWPYITWLEANPGRLETRTTAVGHAHAVVLDMEGWLSMQTGFPAGRVADQPELRERDLGIELMLQAPESFTPDFTAPPGSELCAKLKTLWEQAGETDRAATLALECEASEDLLAAIRENAGIVAVALPDPPFTLRHALAQIHLAEHYLDGLDSRLADNPLGHSAKLIRQALFTAPSGGEANPLAEFRGTIDTTKLDATLEQAERNAALAVVRSQLDALERLASQGQLTAVLRDFTSHDELGICEGYALCGDLYGVLQQLPGVLHDQGDTRQEARTRQLLKTLLTDRELQALWSADENEATDESADDDTNDGSGNFRPAFLRRLAQDDRDIDEALAESLGLETLGLVAQNQSEQEQTQQAGVLSVANAIKVGGLVNTVVGQWSQAVLRVAERVGDDVEVVHMRRVFTAVGAHANLVDGSLRGELQVMQRGEVDLSRYVIIGVHGDGIEWGLTDRDRTSGVLQTQRDYLYAEQVDPRGNAQASTSPKRMSSEVDDAIRQAAGHVLVYVLPAGHPEAAKVAQLRLTKLAGQVKVVMDGPSVSRLLVGFAIYNLGKELSSAAKAYQDGMLEGLQVSKVVSGLVDLSAASMKLHSVLYPEPVSVIGRISQRPLVDMKSWPIIGKRLAKVGASTLVRTIGLFNFFAGVITVGVSSWELRNSLQQGDRDAAIGHGVAIAGGALFLAAPLMAGLIMVPGWGWALLGLGLAIGGSSYAAMNQDTPFEQLLRQGPLGTHPASTVTSADDTVYYPQLLTQLSPAQIEVSRYGSLGAEERQALLESVWESSTDAPSSRDYVVTISTPLISRYKIGETLNLAVQELEQTDTGTITPLGTYEQLSHITRAPEPFEIGKRQLLPQQSAVRFLVKRKVAEESFEMGGTSVTSTARLRVALQARIEWELGEMVLPTPMLKEYEPFVEGQHDALPARSYRTVNNPIVDFIRSFTGRSQDPRYWYIKEFQV
ncbi:toxin VasX [Billgrantia lactosivorans]|uniref:toxin VasX n=1 Tax=Billgrantia lactosivorans TaxID=2185141 RepID=UPI000DAE2192|nr:toxin VasX [Halomonas lactosivorans]